MKVRTFIPAVILSLSIGGCLCAPSEPKAVTLRLKNTSRDPLYVDNSDGRLGMVVQRGVNGQNISFVETPACACQACDSVCAAGTCMCPDPTKLVQKVDADAQFERQWSGIVQIDSTTGCGGFGGTMCLAPENAPYNETFNLHFCYALQAMLSGVSTDGGSVEGGLPGDITCVDKLFHIEDGVVEVSPTRGADCVTTADCKGTGELCFSGACTASCPDNSYPPEVQSTLRVGINDQGFFTSTIEGPKTTYVGSGTVGSATYNTSALRIFLTRTGTAGETLTATLDLDVPSASQLGPLLVGQKVSVRIIDMSETAKPTSNVGMVIRDENGALLIVADSALGAANLSPTDLAPFTVTFDTQPTGCRMTDCGKELFSATKFSDGVKTVSLEPGSSANIVNTMGTYRAVTVFAGTYTDTTTCDLKVIRPYIIWRDKGP